MKTFRGFGLSKHNSFQKATAKDAGGVLLPGYTKKWR
jgi:hypothetical protein